MAPDVERPTSFDTGKRTTEETDSRGFAWAPWVDVRRYGIMDGLVKPIFTHLSPISLPPPIIEHAPEAGREDFQHGLRRNRPDQK